MRPICYGIVGALAAGLTACGIATGIQPAGPDAFRVTEMFTPAQGGFERAKRVALADATRFCEDRGKTFLPKINRVKARRDQPISRSHSAASCEVFLNFSNRAREQGLAGRLNSATPGRYDHARHVLGWKRIEIGIISSLA